MSDNPTLLVTRAAILSDWQCQVANFTNAASVLRAGPYDLIIICQTVPESLAIELLPIARMINAQIKVLTILPAGDISNRSYESEYYTVDFAEPGRLRDAVAKLVPFPAIVST